uniref:Uncharacterized protein n=1 Tax=Parascaris univalens TaxID=6257 RepID=A0A915CCK1_PARUN
MKVFTVGLDEKPPIKEPSTPESVTVVPPPVITVEKKKGSYKGYMMCVLTVFFILLFGVVLSEIAYNRARDENYLRLRWAELKQRMAMSMGWGCENCMNNMMSKQQAMMQPIYQPRTLEQSDTFSRIEAAPIIATSVETTTSEPTATTTLPQEESSNNNAPKIQSESAVDPRFEFLRQILTKIREQAEKAGIDGTMQISLVRVDPMEERQELPSFLDGFGEVRPPVATAFGFSPLRSVFGPWSLEDYYNENDDSRQLPDFISNRRPNMMGPPMIAPPMASPVMMGPPIMGPPPAVMFMGNQMANRPGQALQIISEDRIMQNIPQAPVVPPQPAPDMDAQPWRNAFGMGAQVQHQPPTAANQWQNGIQANPRTNNGPWMDMDRWQASLQRNNEWNIQKSNLLDNLDERMSQAVSHVQQEGPSAWNNEYQWGSNANQQQQQPAAPIFIRQPFNMPSVQTQQQQQQQPIFFHQQVLGNENQMPVPVGPAQFPVPQEQNAEYHSQQQQQFPPQVPHIPTIPQALPIVQQTQPVMTAITVDQPRVLPQIPNTWPRTDAIATPVPMRPIGDGNNVEAPVQDSPKTPLVDNVPFTPPQRKIPFQVANFPTGPLSEATQREQPAIINPIFFQVDEPRHLDDSSNIINV